MGSAAGPSTYSPTASRPPSRLGRVTSTVPVAGAMSRQMATAHFSKSVGLLEMGVNGSKHRSPKLVAGGLLGGVADDGGGWRCQHVVDTSVHPFAPGVWPMVRFDRR